MNYVRGCGAAPGARLVQTTERYLGTKQDLVQAVSDRVKIPVERKTYGRDGLAWCRLTLFSVMSSSEMVPVPLIENRILLIRGEKVLLDSDLAELYGVPTKVFNQAVKRNRRRFPDDFMFRLTLQEGREVESLRSQIVTLKRGGHRKYSPFVFTEQGIAMLSSVLNSERAILVNIAIIRTFVRLRQILAMHEELARQMEELRLRQSEQGQQIQAVFKTMQPFDRSAS